MYKFHRSKRIVSHQYHQVKFGCKKSKTLAHGQKFKTMFGIFIANLLEKEFVFFQKILTKKKVQFIFLIKIPVYSQCCE
jgi:hypothetical protein